MDYSTDAQNLRLFPNTLKIFTLQWFMGLPEKCITTWEGMRQSFLNKYQGYSKARELKEEIFRMVLREDESLEDQLERFLYNIQCSKQHKLDPKMKNIIFLKGVMEESMKVIIYWTKRYLGVYFR